MTEKPLITIKSRFGSADMIIGNNVLSHVPGINEFLSAVRSCLLPAGVAVFEFPYIAYGLPLICRECLGSSALDWCYDVSKILVLMSLTYGTAWLLVAALSGLDFLSLALGFGCGSVAFVGGSYLLIGDELRLSLTKPINDLIIRWSKAA